MALVLGVAFGPRATVVEVRDADTGGLAATGRARHVDLGPGVDVDDPTAWWRSVVAAVTHAGQREIAAISVCGGHPGLVLLDGAGAVLRPVQPWAEAHGERDALRLREALGAERWAEVAGMVPTARSAAARLAWLRRSDPETFARIGSAMLPHDWLTYRLAGRAVTDRGSASLTGFWSPASGAWIPEVLREVGGADVDWAPRLPEVLGPSDQADWLTAPVYELLGLRGRPVVGAGTGEPMAVALALGVVPGRVAVSLGATTTVLAGLSAPIIDPTGGVRSRADAAGHHLAITTAAGGITVVGVIGDLLEMSADELGTMALAAPPAGLDTVLVPGIPGRSGGVLAGLRPGLDRSQLARVVFDGVACAALDAIDQVTDVGATWDPAEPLRLAGPPDGLEAHAQVLATRADRVVVPTPSGSLAAAGACVQAAAALTGAAPEEVSEAWNLGGGRGVEPAGDPERAARRLTYTEERSRQRRALLD